MGTMRRSRVCHLIHQQVSCIRMKLFRINHYPLLHQFQPSPARPLSDDAFVCVYTYVMRVEKPIEVCCCCCHYDPTSHQSWSFLSFSLPYICPSTCHITTASSHYSYCQLPSKWPALPPLIIHIYKCTYNWLIKKNSNLLK